MRTTIVILLAILLGPLQGQAQPPSEVVDRVINSINDIRSEDRRCGKKYMKAVDPVTWNDLLYHTAASHAQDMLDKNYFGHISKDGKDVGSRFDEHGYNWQFAGENLGEGQDSFQEVVKDWLESPSHCRMIMNPDMKEMGLSKRGRFWVQHFGAEMPKNYKRTNTRYSEGK